MFLFLNQKVSLIIHKQTRILLFHLKNMKYSAALPMFLTWRLHVTRKLLSFDKMRFFFVFFFSLRKHPFLLAPRRWGRLAKSEEKRMFSQAIFFFARSRLKNVSFHEKKNSQNSG